jgi:tetratricopeptide (TPR) repeat protein
MGLSKIAAVRWDEVEGHIAQAMRISPRDPHMHAWYVVAGAAKLFLCQTDDAIVWFRRSAAANRAFATPRFYLAAAYAEQGRLEEAKAEITEALALDSTFTLRRYRAAYQSRDPTYLARRGEITENLRRAGLPE